MILTKIDNINGLPERVRSILDNLITESVAHENIPSEIKHMLVSICYQLYRLGWRDALRTSTRTITNLEKLL